MSCLHANADLRLQARFANIGLTTNNCVQIAYDLFFFIATVLFAAWYVAYPHIISNEYVYLIGSRRVYDPSFLAFDFTWNPIPQSTFLFDYIVSPLWRWFELEEVVRIGRLSSCLLLAAALLALQKAMGIARISMLIGFVLWVCAGQSIAAHSWILKGFEPKALAYPGLLISVSAFMRQRYTAAAIAIIITAALHPAVGCWSALVLLGTSVFSWLTRKPIRATTAFYVTLMGALLMVYFWLSVLPHRYLSAREIQASANQYVYFRVPHHLSPAIFLQKDVWILLIATAVPLLFNRWARLRPHVSHVLSLLAATLIVSVCCAAAAGMLGFVTVLTTYPFRIQTVLLPLFFFILITRIPSGLISLPKGRKLSLLLPVTAVVIVVIYMPVYEKVRRRISYGLHASLLTYVKPRPPGSDPVCDYIRSETPRGAVFITPYYASFWMQCERAQVASFKHQPVDERLGEWFERLIALNDFRPFATRGYAITGEYSAAVDSMSEETLETIAKRYGATHYLTRQEREDLRFKLLRSSDRFWLYELGM